MSMGRGRTQRTEKRKGEGGEGGEDVEDEDRMGDGTLYDSGINAGP